MEVLHERCCGLDVHKKSITACIITPDGKEIRTFATMTQNLIELARKLYNDAFVYTAFDSTNLGFIAFYANDVDSRTAYIAQIAMHREHVNKKIGRTLLKLAIVVAEVRGMTTLKLEVHKNNSNAIRFYERTGFEFCGEASAKSMYMMKKL